MNILARALTPLQAAVIYLTLTGLSITAYIGYYQISDSYTSDSGEIDAVNDEKVDTPAATSDIFKGNSLEPKSRGKIFVIEEKEEERVDDDEDEEEEEESVYEEDEESVYEEDEESNYEESDYEEINEGNNTGDNARDFEKENGIDVVGKVDFEETRSGKIEEKAHIVPISTVTVSIDTTKTNSTAPTTTANPIVQIHEHLEDIIPGAVQIATAPIPIATPVAVIVTASLVDQTAATPTDNQAAVSTTTASLATVLVVTPTVPAASQPTIAPAANQPVVDARHAFGPLPPTGFNRLAVAPVANPANPASQFSASVPACTKTTSTVPKSDVAPVSAPLVEAVVAPTPNAFVAAIAPAPIGLATAQLPAAPADKPVDPITKASPVPYSNIQVLTPAVSQAVTAPVQSATTVTRSVLAVNQPSLYNAIERGVYDEIEAVLNNGADANAIHAKLPLLHHCIEKCSIEVVELMLVFGADVMATNKYGRRAIHQAAALDKPAVIELLIKNCDINARTLKKADYYPETPPKRVDKNKILYGATALHVAFQKGNFKSASKLAAMGSKLSTKDEMGNTSYECDKYGIRSLVDLSVKNIKAKQ